MFRGPSFIVSTMQEETTPIFKRLWYDWTQQQPGIEPTNPLGQCWVPPIVAFYDQQGLLRTYSLPGSSIRSSHPGSPRGCSWRSEHGFNIEKNRNKAGLFLEHVAVWNDIASKKFNEKCIESTVPIQSHHVTYLNH